jgi:hypothetical protein
MDAKRVLVLLSILAFPGIALAKGGKEEQRKYVVTETPALEKFLVDGRFEDLTLKRHVVYEMVDFYVDTSAEQVKAGNLSLRIRRAVKDEGKVEYEFQFKSEMESAGAVRMEVEEKELLPLQIAGGRSLTDAIEAASVACRDAVRSGGAKALRANGKATKAVADLTEWLRKGVHSTLEPFQEMRARKIEITGLRPVMCGLANRARTRIEEKRADGSRAYVMEASLDHATFLPLVPAKNERAVVSELEVENKDPDKSAGRKAMNRLESVLLERYGAKPGLASKYLQADRGLEFETP